MSRQARENTPVETARKMTSVIHAGRDGPRMTSAQTLHLERFGAAQKDAQMQFIRRMNERPSAWLLLGTLLGAVGYLFYLVGKGMTW